MKKLFVLVFLVIFSFNMIGCRKNTNVIDVADKKKDITVLSEVIEEIKQPLELTFSSGVGGWYNSVVLNSDGTFKGHYQDTDMGTFGGDYPDGTVYICDYHGKFGEFKKVDETTYKLTLKELNTTTQKEAWIKDKIMYVPSSPYGIEDGEEFILYMPGTDKKNLPEYIRDSWQLEGYMQQSKEAGKIPCYILFNPATESEFYSNN